jgi:hypothetical protein
MKEQIDFVVNWIKSQPIRGCITGSCLLNYFEGQDIDVFVYDEKAFATLFYAMYYNEDFQVLDPLERLKVDMYLTKVKENTVNKFGLMTIKFTYNTCVDVNIVLKKNCDNVFSVISTFDLDIIAKGFDIQTKQYLDLSKNNGLIVDWNRWNSAYYTPNIWTATKLLRQIKRCFKYHDRGYNTDLVIKKYISLIDELVEYETLSSQLSVEQKVNNIKSNALIVKKICEVWLQTHKITEEELELLDVKMKELEW